MDIGRAFPSKYLKAADLGSGDVAVTIKEVRIEAVGQTKQDKPILYFKGAPKGLVLNQTNSKRIASIARSNDTDDWKGVKIVLYSTETEFQGDTVDCIRVRLQKSKSAASESVPVTKRNATKPIKSKEPEPDDPIPDFPDEEPESADHDDPEPDEDPFSGA